jgi:hypothetical protein
MDTATISTSPTTRKRRAWSVVASVLSALLLAAGAVIIVGLLAFPTATEKIAGETKVAVEGLVAQAMTQATGELPSVTLGGEGPKSALDHAEHGVFTEMESYRIPGVLPVFAAHNNRGGDVVLSLAVGQQVRVIDTGLGTEKVYVVVEERITKKWQDVDTLVGLKGELALQTCFYGENRMRFLGLQPLEQQDAGQAVER